MWNDLNLVEQPALELWVGLGIGGKVTIDFGITESWYFEIGCAFAYDFSSLAPLFAYALLIDSPVESRELHIMPHIGFCIRN
jgi:hypothetical protein